MAFSAAGRNHLQGWTCPALACLLAVSGCGGDSLILPQEGEPAALVLLGGDDQSDTVGRVLHDTLMVRLTDPVNRPIQHQGIEFIGLSQSGGRAIPDTAQTDADGRARIRWVLGTVAGPQTIRARVAAPGGTLSVDFHAAALAGAADIILPTAGDSQGGVVGSALNELLTATVADRYGNPVSGVTTHWSAIGGGSVNPATTTSGSNGQVSVQRTLGGSPGEQRTIVAASGLKGSPVVFIQTSIQGQPADLIAESGNNQSGPPGQPLPSPLVVRLVDAMGNGIPGGTVAWPVVTGAGTISSAMLTTDAGGRASATWTLGPVAGSNVVIPVSSGFTATFTAVTTAGTMSRLAIVRQPSAGGVSGVPLAVSPVVQLQDVNGNDVGGSGVLVTATIAGSPPGASLGSATAVTDAGGTAAFSGLTITGPAGSYALLFTGSPPLTGASSGTIVLTGSAATRLALSTQPSSTVLSGQAFPQQPVLQLVDGSGAPVRQAGVVCSAALASGSPALGGTLTATTDAGGTATFADLSISGVAGQRTLTFAAPGLTGVTSSAIDVQTGGAAQTITMLVQPSATAINGASFQSQPVVRVVNQLGLPVIGVSVSVSVATGGGTLSGQTVSTTGLFGTANFSALALTGTAGSYTLRFATATAATITTSIGLTAGPADASQSTADVPDPGKTRKQTAITVQTRDQSGNDLTAGGHTISISVSGTNPVAAFAATDNGDGSYSGGYTPTRKGNDLVTITLDGAPVAGSPYPSRVK